MSYLLSEIKSLELPEGNYEFHGSLPDGRQVMLDVVVMNVSHSLENGYNYECNLDVEMWDVDNNYETPDRDWET